MEEDASLAADVLQHLNATEERKRKTLRLFCKGTAPWIFRLQLSRGIIALSVTVRHSKRLFLRSLRACLHGVGDPGLVG